MSHLTFSAIRFEHGFPSETSEQLVAEAALQITLNGRPYTVTMQTPGQEIWLATGLLFTEGIIHAYTDVLSAQLVYATDGSVRGVSITLPEALLQQKNVFNRSIASSASCGVCGKTELCDIAISGKITSTDTLDVDTIPLFLRHMQQHQRLFDQTGGSHAASIFDTTGQLLAVQEDIGRHNAVDKAIGQLLQVNKLAQAAVLLVSGRVSYEIVAKCVQAQIPFLLSVSAPSSLAVELCEQRGITLLAFCRENRATVYTHTKRLIQPELVTK